MNKKSITLGKVLLVTLAFLAIVMVVLPNKASAQYEDDGYEHFLSKSANPIPEMSSITPRSVKYQDNTTQIMISGRGFMPNSIARWNGQNRTITYIDYNNVIVNLNPEDLRSNGGYINIYNPNRQAYSNAIQLKVSGYVASNNDNGMGNTNYNYSGQNNGNSNTADSNRNTNGGYFSNENQSGNNVNNEGEQNISSLASGAIFGSNSFAPSGIIQWVLFAIIILLIVIIVRKFFGGADRYHNTPLKHD